MATVLQYLHPDDNLVADITPSLPTGTPDAEYPVAYLVDGDPSVPWKAASTTFRLVWNLGAATQVGFIGIFHHNFDAGLTGLKFEANATDSWGSPTFSQTLTVPAYQETWPTNIGADLAAPPTLQYVSLACTVANTVLPSVGEIVIAPPLRELSGGFKLGAVDDESHPLAESQTLYGVSHRFLYGQRVRRVSGEAWLTPADALLVRQWNRATQNRARPFVVWVPCLDVDEPWFVFWDGDSLPRERNELHAYQMGFVEVSRGLIPTPSGHLS